MKLTVLGHRHTSLVSCFTDLREKEAALVQAFLYVFFFFFKEIELNSNSY